MFEQYFFIFPILALLTLGAITPGPSFILVAQTAMSKSRAQAIYIAIGLGIGATSFALLASFGLVTLLKLVPELYVMFKVFGGLYLCYLAFNMWRSANDPITSDTTEEPLSFSGGRTILFGLAAGLSNPKTAVVFSSVFAAMLPINVPENSTLFISLGVFVINTAWYSIVAFLLSTQKAQNGYLHFRRSINRVASSLIGAMGLRFIYTSGQN